MTTVWPIIVLGLVATTLLLLPVLLKGTSFPGNDSVAERGQNTDDLGARDTDKNAGNPLHWSYLLVAALLPLAVSLLLLWGVAAGELGRNDWWIPLVIMLPTALGALTAWNLQRRGYEGESGG